MPNLQTLAATAPWEWPESARETLTSIVGNSNGVLSERLLAAELLGHVAVMDNEVAAALLTIVQAAVEPERLRGKAAISLGPILEQADVDGFDDPDMVPISEKMFRAIQRTLHKVYSDDATPKEVRRRTLEAAVRAPQEWQKAAVRAAWSSGDPAWKLTAVFAMAHVPGFDEEILEALDSADQDIHYEAVTAAGNMEIDAAWPHVAALVTAPDTDKDLLIAAVGAIATIRPAEALEMLADLADHDDHDVVEAVHDALTKARGLSEYDDEAEEDESDADLDDEDDLGDLEDGDEDEDEGWEDEDDEEEDEDEEEDDDEPER